jgi:hypothetical protein
VPQLPARLVNALQAADVQGAIKKALNDFAVNRLKATPTTLSPQDAQELAQAVAKAGGEAVGQNILEGITKSAHFQALDSSLKDLTARQSPPRPPTATAPRRSWASASARNSEGGAGEGRPPRAGRGQSESGGASS